MLFFFKQKTAYEMRISDWSSDVCSSDLTQVYVEDGGRLGYGTSFEEEPAFDDANCERDTLVRPIHPNTTRSSAWRSAGAQQVEAVVKQALHANSRLGIERGRYLFGAENERSVLQDLNRVVQRKSVYVRM